MVSWLKFGFQEKEKDKDEEDEEDEAIDPTMCGKFLGWRILGGSNDADLEVSGARKTGIGVKNNQLVKTWLIQWKNKSTKIYEAISPNM